MWIDSLFYGTGVAHNILLVSAVIAIGLALSRIKIGGVSLGVTWVLFTGIVASHFGLLLDDATSHFIKEFGLILFIYSVGMQVGPGFFSSFRKGGVTLNALSVALVLTGSFLAYVIHLATGENLGAMVGVLYGAVTNTPGLGAAQQTFSDIHSGDFSPLFAQGYAVAYPLGVLGIILCLILLKVMFRVNLEEEQKLYDRNNPAVGGELTPVIVEVLNSAVCGRTLSDIQRLSGREVVATRIMRSSNGNVELATAQTKVQMGDRVFLVAKPNDIEALTILIGRQLHADAEKDWFDDANSTLVNEKFIVTNAKMQGRRLSDLRLHESFHVNVSRVRRSGIELLARPALQLQLGDRVTVVGRKEDVDKVSALLGNSVKRLDQPRLLCTFLGIAIGVLLGSLPVALPGMPVPVKLGLAGGPLIVSILLSYYGPRLHLVTYSTSSANLLMREVGICLFMASVGLGAGQGFVSTVCAGGYWWVLYGFIITFVPCMLIGIVARYVFNRSYFTIIGMISGGMTDPPALAYSNSVCGNDQASIAYSTVYPLSMFLRVLVAQVLVLFGCQ